MNLLFVCYILLFLPLSEVKESKPSNLLQNLEGKKLYESKCIKCHSLKNPLLTSKAKWERIFPKMARKAKLTEAEANIIKKYIFSFDLE